MKNSYMYLLCFIVVWDCIFKHPKSQSLYNQCVLCIYVLYKSVNQNLTMTLGSIRLYINLANHEYGVQIGPAELPIQKKKKKNLKS